MGLLVEHFLNENDMYIFWGTGMTAYPHPTSCCSVPYIAVWCFIVLVIFDTLSRVSSEGGVCDGHDSPPLLKMRLGRASLGGHVVVGVAGAGG